MIERSFFVNVIQYHDGQFRNLTIGPMFKVHEYPSEAECVQAAMEWRSNLGPTTEGVLSVIAPITGIVLQRRNYGADA